MEFEPHQLNRDIFSYNQSTRCAVVQRVQDSIQYQLSRTIFLHSQGVDYVTVP